MSAENLRKLILEADDLSAETMEIPEWGVTIELREPSAADRSDLIAMMAAVEEDDERLRTMQAAAVIAMAFDPETGDRVFDSDQETIDAIIAKSGKVVERVAMAGLRLAGLSEEAVEEGKDDS